MMIRRVKAHVVSRSLRRLREQKTHTLFAGYLHLQQQTCLLGRLQDLQPQFLSFFEKFFLVPDHPLGTPFIKPFERSPSDKNLWLNKNVAGTYAPSSLRQGQPFRKVVTIERGVYTLETNHARAAREHLLSEPIHVADLAVFLYRDFGLIGDAVTIHDLINIFAFEFGYSSREGMKPDDSFHVLFEVGSTKDWDDDWLEPI